MAMMLALSFPEGCLWRNGHVFSAIDRICLRNDYGETNVNRKRAIGMFFRLLSTNPLGDVH